MISQGYSSVCVYYVQDIKFPISLDMFELCADELQQRLMPARNRFKEQEDRRVVQMEKVSSCANSSPYYGGGGPQGGVDGEGELLCKYQPHIMEGEGEDRRVEQHIEQEFQVQDDIAFYTIWYLVEHICAAKPLHNWLCSGANWFLIHILAL